MAGFAAKGARLVVTVDCGAVSHEPFAHARQLGLDVIVFDHHQAPETLPRRWRWSIRTAQDDLSGLGHLAAAGVVYMALVALNRALRQAGFWNGRKAPELIAALDLVALATVADVVPLTGLQPRFCGEGPRGHAPAPPVRDWRLSSMSPARTGRRDPIIWASSSARASTPAGGSATRAWAPGC